MGRSWLPLCVAVLLQPCSCAAAAFADVGDFNLRDTVRGLPNMVKDNWRQFRTGTSQMWQNGKAAKAVRQRVSSAITADVPGTTCYTLSELQLLRRTGEDTGKLVKCGIVWIFLPELFPALLYFTPRALPSTFESEKGRTERHATLARMRTTAVLELLGSLEEQAAKQKTGRKALAAASAREVAERALRAGSTSRALAYVQSCATRPQIGDKAFAPLTKVESTLARRTAAEAKRRKRAAPKAGTVSGAGKAALLGISQPCLKAGCKLIGSSGPQPGPMRRATLGKHLEQLVEEDAVLLAGGTRMLTREQLTEACLDRGFGSDNLSDAQLRARLDQWLDVVEARKAGRAQAAGEQLEPHRLRLAAMAACATTAVRSERESMSVLPRLLYAH